MAGHLDNTYIPEDSIGDETGDWREEEGTGQSDEGEFPSHDTNLKWQSGECQ